MYLALRSCSSHETAQTPLVTIYRQRLKIVGVGSDGAAMYGEIQFLSRSTS